MSATATATTTEGYSFDPAQATWRIRTLTRRLLFRFDIPGTEEALQQALHGAFGRMLSERNPDYCYAALSGLRVLLRHAALRRGGSIEVLCLADFESYRSGLPAARQYHASRVLNYLRNLAEIGFDGMAPDLASLLHSLHVAGVRRASPANIGCPRRGALSSSDRAYLKQALDAARMAKLISSANHALALLVLTLGPRPSQVALLKVGDLAPYPRGSTSYGLAMPYLKVPRGQRRGRRAPPVPLDPELARVLAAQCKAAIAAGAVLGRSAGDCPMFPSVRRARANALQDLSSTAGHDLGPRLAMRLQRIFAKLDLSGMPGTDAERRITATRLRRTLATLLRDEGCTFDQVGTLLWQQRPGTARIYVGPTAGHRERVEAAFDFGPLAETYRRELAAAAAEAAASKETSK